MMLSRMIRAVSCMIAAERGSRAVVVAVWDCIGGLRARAASTGGRTARASQTSLKAHDSIGATELSDVVKLGMRTPIPQVSTSESKFSFPERRQCGNDFLAAEPLEENPLL